MHLKPCTSSHTVIRPSNGLTCLSLGTSTRSLHCTCCRQCQSAWRSEKLWQHRYKVDCNRSPIPIENRKRQQQEIRNQTMETYQKYLIEVYQGRTGVVNGIPNSEIRRVANYENRRQLPVSPRSRPVSTCYYYALLLFYVFCLIVFFFLWVFRFFLFFCFSKVLLTRCRVLLC